MIGHISMRVSRETYIRWLQNLCGETLAGQGTQSKIELSPTEFSIVGSRFETWQSEGVTELTIMVSPGQWPNISRFLGNSLSISREPILRPSQQCGVGIRGSLESWVALNHLQPLLAANGLSLADPTMMLHFARLSHMSHNQLWPTLSTREELEFGEPFLK